jgi:hypothetical protein
MEFHLRGNSNKSQDNKPQKKVNFPFKDNIIYVIYYKPPFAYIRQADQLLITAFDNFVDEWTIEYKGVEGKVKAILLYYGLPLMKEKVPKSLIPNVEDLEKTSDIEIYYYIAMQWILKYLENTNPRQLMKIVDLMRDSRGIPIKVKELEDKKIRNFTGNPKGVLYDLIDIIQSSKEINLEEALPQGGKMGILKALGSIMPKSIEQVRSVLYFILIIVIFVIAFVFIKDFAATLGNVAYQSFLNEYKTYNITSLIHGVNTTNITILNETYNITNPLK